MTGGFLDGDVFRGLAFLILLFLSLALLPFGLIAVVQTRELADQATHNAESSLIALTERAASSERATLQEGFGVAAALGSVIRVYRDDSDTCAVFMAEYRQVHDIYSLVGYLPTDGVMTCSSADRSHDFSGSDNFRTLMENQRRSVVVDRVGRLSGEGVLVISHPFQDEGAFAGYITLSVPISSIKALPAPRLEKSPLDLLIFNDDGEVLTSSLSPEVTDALLPTNRSLSALVGEKPAVFVDQDQQGTELRYAVAPILPGVVYSMSIWNDAAVTSGLAQAGRLSILLPGLMWLASLIVAFWSINRLAIRHIRKLGRQMRLFAYNRAMPRSVMGAGVPRELAEIQHAFLNMAESIIRDEAALEDSLRDKNILLKEVHHRVKNNLQLISSIMNMQIRRAQSDDARFVLKRLQERILSLATVHKSLYQQDALDRVDAGALVKEIVAQLLVVGLPAGSRVRVNQSYGVVELDADDAAPLTLLISEAVTNALKYMQQPKSGERAHLDISLRMDGPESAVFQIANSTGSESGSDGTGLGTQLINAFARQLSAHAETMREADLHRLTVRFPVQHLRKAVADF